MDKLKHEGVNRNEVNEIKEMPRDGDNSMNNDNSINVPCKIPLGISNALACNTQK